MTEAEQRIAARQFITDWKERVGEKQETQSFWLMLLQRVFGIVEPDKLIAFELPVRIDGTTKFIDGYIKSTGVLIEQKGAKIDLRKGERQSDGAILTPFGQARRYGEKLPHDMNPRWIVVCNFQSFEIHDMNRPNEEPEIVLLENLEKEYHRLGFLVDTGNENIKKEMEISLQAGELVGKLYDALLKQYKDPDDPATLQSLNKLCVRLVFCLYAEDAGIFGKRNLFHDYLQAHSSEARQALINLFHILDQKEEERDPYLDDDLLAFPYVNGGLFADESIEIPRLTEEIVEIILQKASEDFDWSEISPTIFGAVFESTLNPETRRSGGMHYTSIENIHKVIDPLFLDELKAELAEILSETVEKTRKARLEAYQKKLSSLTFLDPACGSGNFLTETYLSLRRLENQVISELRHGQTSFGEVQKENPIQVSIGQFYGIEINDFAVTVAKTALWIAESQMMKETEDVVHMALDFLPLKSYANIAEGNALRLDWNEVVPKEKLHYIMGNPPFVGASMMTAEQKGDAVAVFGKIKLSNSIDYVGAWYHKAADFMSETTIRTAFVSTNSITQGEQVAPLWEKLFIDYKIHIDFAYRTFRWDSEASLKAHVHCVIVGFSSSLKRGTKLIYTDNGAQTAININAYLIDGPDVFISSRSKPLCDVTEMVYGNKPTDDGNFILTQEERDTVLCLEPELEKYIHPYIGSVEFIN